MYLPGHISLNSSTDVVCWMVSLWSWAPRYQITPVYLPGTRYHLYFIHPCPTWTSIFCTLSALMWVSELPTFCMHQPYSWYHLHTVQTHLFFNTTCIPSNSTWASVNRATCVLSPSTCISVLSILCPQPPGSQYHLSVYFIFSHLGLSNTLAQSTSTWVSVPPVPQSQGYMM